MLVTVKQYIRGYTRYSRQTGQLYLQPDYTLGKYVLIESARAALDNMPIHHGAWVHNDFGDLVKVLV